MESSALNEAFIQSMISLSDEQKLQLLDSRDNGYLDEFLKMLRGSGIERLVDINKERPQILKDLLEDDVSAEQVLDYIQDLEARTHIFRQFHRLSNDLQAGAYLDAALFSVFMVAPISQLEYQLQKLQDLAAAKDSAGIASYFVSISSIRSGIQAYANRGGRQAQSASNSSRNSPLPSPAKVPTPGNPLKRKFESDDQVPSGSNLDLQASALQMAVPLQPSTPRQTFQQILCGGRLGLRKYQMLFILPNKPAIIPLRSYAKSEMVFNAF